MVLPISFTYQYAKEVIIFVFEAIGTEGHELVFRQSALVQPFRSFQGVLVDTGSGQATVIGETGTQKRISMVERSFKARVSGTFIVDRAMFQNNGDYRVLVQQFFRSMGVELTADTRMLRKCKQESDVDGLGLFVRQKTKDHFRIPDVMPRLHRNGSLEYLREDLDVLPIPEARIG